MKDALTVPKKLQAKIKKADPEVRNFILALHKEILKLRKEKGDLQVENMSLHDGIKSLPAFLKFYLENQENIKDTSHKRRKQLITKLEKALRQ